MRRRAFLSILFVLLTALSLSAATSAMLETRALVIVYDEGLDPAAREILRAYPTVKQALETLLQWPLRIRPYVVLISNPEKFRELAGHELVVAYALPDKNAVVIDYSRMNTSPFELQTIVKHELCHLLLHDHIRGDHLPRWLDEGICQWASDGLADILIETRRALLPAAVLSESVFDLSTLARRFPQDKSGLILAYEQSKSAVEYMSRRFGPQGIRDLLGMLKQGFDFETAFEKRFSISFEAFENQWRDDLKSNLGWFTYLSVHLYEILFVSAALLTIFGFIRRLLTKRAYEKDGGEGEEL